MRVDIKPLTVNQAFQGKRYDTLKYKDWKSNIGFLLPKRIDIPAGDLAISVNFGLSTRASDLDNCLKPFLDALTKKYGINDNRYYSIKATKEIVSKGKEFIEFEIKNKNTN